jgi:hypothetical protein
VTVEEGNAAYKCNGGLSIRAKGGGLAVPLWQTQRTRASGLVAAWGWAMTAHGNGISVQGDRSDDNIFVLDRVAQNCVNEKSP